MNHRGTFVVKKIRDNNDDDEADDDAPGMVVGGGGMPVCRWWHRVRWRQAQVKPLLA
jgi:hypothetical protein